MAKYLDADGLAVLSSLVKRGAAGSYVGTGENGSANPNVLTFDFEPHLLIITLAKGFGWYNSQFNGSLIWVEGETSFSQNINGDSGTCNISRSGGTISWYRSSGNNSRAEIQLNKSGQTYYYVAIG